MIIKNLDGVEKKPVDMEGAKSVSKQLPIGRAEDTPLMSFRVFTIAPGGNTPHHRHPFEHINYVISGEGALVDEKGIQHPVKQGDFVLVNPDEKHNYRNTGESDDFVMICAVPKEFE
jgi:quercetin dioxygenase-like cupin family protein